MNPGSSEFVVVADRCLRAAVEVARYSDDHGPLPWPPDFYGGALAPAYLFENTKEEVEEACAFLVRLGVLERPRQKARRRDP